MGDASGDSISDLANALENKLSNKNLSINCMGCFNWAYAKKK